MEECLERRVAGQDDAVRIVANAVRRAAAGMSDPRRPVGSFLFHGPPGVGKAELAGATARFLFGDLALVRLDMEEYADDRSVSRLIGAPEGDGGGGEEGTLTGPVSRRPGLVILFDGVEKAAPGVFRLLPRILEEARLEDGTGREVDFRSCVLILASDAVPGGRGTPSGGEGMGAREGGASEPPGTIRPEVRNRLDEIVRFRPLGIPDLERIVTIKLGELNARLSERGIAVSITEAARRRLAGVGWDSAGGAGPLPQAIRRHVEDPLAVGIVGGRYRDGASLVVDFLDNIGFFFREAGRARPVGDRLDKPARRE
jgi:ATP-dependent Clp protease ATP-binding subunit ClpB